MKTIIAEVTGKISQEVINQAAEIIRGGGIVAFPTETVYGLGADALNPKAVKKVYEVKGRPQNNPLILHLARGYDLSFLVKEVPEKARILIDKFWPGPLTLILKKSKHVPFITTGGLDSVALRIPDQEVAQSLIEKSGVPIAAPSANFSGKGSTVNGKQVIIDFDGRIEMIIDAGEVGRGVPSTILDLTGERPILLRDGAISSEDLEKSIGNILRKEKK